MLAAAVSVALVVLGLLFEPADAWSERQGPPRRIIRGGAVAPPGPTVIVPPGNVVIGAPRPPSHDFGPSYPFGYNYTGQSSVLYSAPAHVAPRWVAGYWGRQWVPRYYTYDVWVPGYYGAGGGWIDGYYEPRTVQSGGYYQQVWVDGYWAQ
jgi:hypothetical protein